MSEHNPDRWVIIEIINPADTVKTSEKLYKVFGGWYGGYAYGDSWRMNSGITKVEKDGANHFLFHGYSGSVYRCRVDAFGMSNYMGQMYDSFLKQAEKEGIPFRFLSFDETMLFVNGELK